MQPLLRLVSAVVDDALDPDGGNDVDGTVVLGLRSNIRCHVHDDRAVVVVQGDVDLASKDEVWAALSFALDHRDRLVLDLGGATFFDSTGLKLILRAIGRQRPGSPTVVIRSPRESVCRLLRATGIDELVVIEDPGSSDAIR